ncbi:hypothetical protein BX283_6556 [Streptomyces sp. TLI_146]|nr:hypothetical protein BX283_6556 [Streptomyces sp. TLI_146]
MMLRGGWRQRRAPKGRGRRGRRTAGGWTALRRRAAGGARTTAGTCADTGTCAGAGTRTAAGTCGGAGTLDGAARRGGPGRAWCLTGRRGRLPLGRGRPYRSRGAAARAPHTPPRCPLPSRLPHGLPTFPDVPSYLTRRHIAIAPARQMDGYGITRRDRRDRRTGYGSFLTASGISFPLSLHSSSLSEFVTPVSMCAAETRKGAAALTAVTRNSNARDLRHPCISRTLTVPLLASSLRIRNAELSALHLASRPFTGECSRQFRTVRTTHKR